VGCHPNNIDLVFVADSSGSIGTADFQLVLSFLNDLVNQAVVGQNQTRIGMAEFSSSPRYVMFLNSFWLASQVKAAIRNTPYIGLGTNIASGMNYALDTLFNPLYGSRPDHRRVMIVLTDGQDGSDVRSAHAKAQSMGIYTVAIGVGVATDYQELVTIAGNPNHVTNINSFANLTSLTAWTCHQILGN
jgi:collagen type VI alpha